MVSILPTSLPKIVYLNNNIPRDGIYFTNIITLYLSHLCALRCFMLCALYKHYSLYTIIYEGYQGYDMVQAIQIMHYTLIHLTRVAHTREKMKTKRHNLWKSSQPQLNHKTATTII